MKVKCQWAEKLMEGEQEHFNKHASHFQKKYSHWLIKSRLLCSALRAFQSFIPPHLSTLFSLSLMYSSLLKWEWSPYCLENTMSIFTFPCSCYYSAYLLLLCFLFFFLPAQKICLQIVREVMGLCRSWMTLGWKLVWD